MPATLTAWNARLVRAVALAALVGVVVFSSGCGVTGPLDWVKNGFKVGPNYYRPPAPIGEEWIEANDPRTQGPPPRDGEWWTIFNDDTLNDLVCRAYRLNPNLRAVGTRILQARAQQGIAVGGLFPQVQQAEGLYSHGHSLGNPFRNDFTGFHLGCELDFWGKYRRQIESANANLDASVENYDAALVTLLADVATNYVQYRVAQMRIKIARDNLEAQKNLVALAEKQQKGGNATLLDVDQLRTLMEQTRSSIPALQIVLGQANDLLCILIGEPPHDLERELGPGPDLGKQPMVTTPISVAADMPVSLLSRRPDVRSAERQIAAQSPQIGVATADLYPSISIGTIIGGLGQTDSGSPPQHGALALVNPQFTWNILNYGRLVNNVRLQDARTQELIALFQGRVLSAAQEVQTSLRAFLRSQEQAEALAKSAEAATRAAKIEEERFKEVKADVNRLFSLESTRLQEQDNLAVAQGNIALNLISVYRALGGGWQLAHRDGACPGPCSAPGNKVRGPADDRPVRFLEPLELTVEPPEPIQAPTVRKRMP
jgi:NodT family efflux transporter outer membrane factor (OMF) lipoprotein